MSTAINNLTLDTPSILIDDADPSIQYDGDWLAMTGPDGGLYIWPGAQSTTTPPLLNTLHSLQDFEGSFSFNFTGIGISVFISNLDQAQNNTAFQCSLDGAPVPTITQLLGHENNIPLCGVSALRDGVLHNMVVNITGTGSKFFLDYMLVKPSPTLSLEGRDLMVSFNEQTINNAGDKPLQEWKINSVGLQNLVASGNWSYDDDPIGGLVTSTFGSTLTFSYLGRAVWWYGYYIYNMPSNSSFPTYTLDGGDPVSFSTYAFTVFGINGTLLPDNSTQKTLFNVPLDTEYGNHSIKVVHNGSSETTPLTLQYMVLLGATPPSSSAPSLSSSPSGLFTSTPATTSPPTTSQSSKSHSTGPIVGAIIGGCAFVLIFSFFMLVAYRRRAAMKSKDPKKLHLEADPFEGDFPFVAPRKARISQKGVHNHLMQEMEAPPPTKWARPLIQRNGTQADTATVFHRSQADNNSRAEPPFSPDHSDGMVESLDTEQQRPLLDPSPPPNTSISTAHRSGSQPLPIATVQEQDSGMRLAEYYQDSSDAAGVQILPPVYTTH
ncbi:hypothetical protein D9619_009238 [Psilocybe cf. subviscida]|uniref:Transmembrane protein n=1 Tax=Psilocybe cf. subviscida TaxID=2480587 RepID=A0A8H5BUM2_9AGAR|nr:hypothetical protein D9619_009238 [Psilocybe cf. subviscida]